MFCSREKGIFVNFDTDSKISPCSRSLFLRYVVGQNQGYRIALMATDKKKNYIFVEFKVNLIYSKQVPFIHNAVLIYAMKSWIGGCVYKTCSLLKHIFLPSLYKEVGLQILLTLDTAGPLRLVR